MASPKNRPPGVDRYDAAPMARYLQLYSAAISTRQLDVYSLYYVEGYSQGMVAAELGITANTVRSHIQQLRAGLKEWLESQKEGHALIDIKEKYQGAFLDATRTPYAPPPEPVCTECDAILDRIVWRCGRRRCDACKLKFSGVKARELGLRRKYGMGLADYDARLEAQKHTCPVCNGRLGTAKRKDPVDHCHRCGGVFAIVHAACNFASSVCDDPAGLRRRADMIESHACSNPSGERVPLVHPLKKKIDLLKTRIRRLAELDAPATIVGRELDALAEAEYRYSMWRT